MCHDVFWVPGPPFDDRQRVEGTLLGFNFQKTEVTELTWRCSSDAVVGTKNWEVEVVVCQAVLATSDSINAQIRLTGFARMNFED